MSRINKISQKSIIIHYGEIGLKGKNQIDFINQLISNVELKLKDLSLDWAVTHPHGYINIEIPANVNEDNIIGKVLNEVKIVFGIVWLAEVKVLGTRGQGLGMEEIEKKLLKIANDKFEPEKTFAIRAHRTDKSYPLNSHEIEVKIGKAVQDKTQWDKVDLDEPDQTFYIDIHKSATHFYTEKIKGLGGLPVGTAGRVLNLLSGGIDSPVASYLMAKRGAIVDCLHFAATHMQLKQAQDYLISKIVQQLSKYTLYSRLFIVPYTHFNLILLDKRVNYELVLFRRFMMRVAERLATQIKAQAIITGDNLAQVASQTLPNLVSTSQAVHIPIFRPLISYDKNETVSLAQEIKTFELSTQPYKDCCSLVSQNPKTISDHKTLTKLEQDILPNFQELIDKTLNEVVVLEFSNGKLL